MTNTLYPGTSLLQLLDALPLQEVGKYPRFLTQWTSQPAAFESWHPLHPAMPNVWEKALARRDKLPLAMSQRQTLSEVLRAQHQMMPEAEWDLTSLAAVHRLARENCYTITTGHQLILYTGPLYFLFKIASVIKACQDLKTQYPDKDFVPIYWMSTEDHDKEEIAAFQFLGRSFTWQTEQTGPVGAYHTEGIADLLAEFPQLPAIWTEVYATSPDLATATRRLVHQLFYGKGLVVIDPSDAQLKQFFVPTMVREVSTPWSLNALDNRTQMLEAAGFPAQIMGRPINLFYMHGGQRIRIVPHATGAETATPFKTWNLEDLVSEIKQYPDRFSPNVVLRPLYQEILLPNLAYFGGPAEIAYWMQLGEVFDQSGMTMPLLVPRHLGMLIPEKWLAKMEKLSLSWKDLAQDERSLKAQILARLDPADSPWPTWENAFQLLWDEMAQTLQQWDASLQGAVAATAAGQAKALEGLRKKSDKAREAKHEQTLQTALKIQQKLFPQGGLQERIEGGLGFFLDDDQWLDSLIRQIQPLDTRFHVWAVKNDTTTL